MAVVGVLEGFVDVLFYSYVCPDLLLRYRESETLKQTWTGVSKVHVHNLWLVWGEVVGRRGHLQ